MKPTADSFGFDSLCVVGFTDSERADEEGVSFLADEADLCLGE